MNSIVAIITARGGSKGIYKKNILNLNGKPMIAYTIEAAIKSNIFSSIVVSTDDDQIKSISIEYGASVVNRPRELATDDAMSVDVIKHALSELKKNKEEFSHFILLQPTSPLRTERHIIEAWAQYLDKDLSSLVSAKNVDNSPFKMLYEDSSGLINPVTEWKHLTMPRQKLSDAFIPNGAIYISLVDNFNKNKDLFNSPLGIYKMNEIDSIDIDSMSDFLSVENELKK